MAIIPYNIAVCFPNREERLLTPPIRTSSTSFTFLHVTNTVTTTIEIAFRSSFCFISHLFPHNAEALNGVFTPYSKPTPAVLSAGRTKRRFPPEQLEEFKQVVNGRDIRNLMEATGKIDPSSHLRLSSNFGALTTQSQSKKSHFGE